MSYIRGDNYLWTDGGNVLHIWLADGYDEWDKREWAADKRQRGLRPSGVGIPEEVLDELVMMRLAQIIEEGIVDETIDRAIANHGGNYGCYPLIYNSEKLKQAMKQVEITAPYLVSEDEIERFEETIEMPDGQGTIEIKGYKNRKDTQ